MQDPLKLLLFCLLLRTGASLKCEVCSGSGFHCKGTVTTCLPHKDTCVIAYTEDTADGKLERSVEKGCETSDYCEFPATELYFGNGKAYRSALFCCNDKTCGKVAPKFPPTEVKLNQKQCPACNVWSETCKEEMVNCTGTNMYCFDVSTRTSTDSTNVDRTMKGCTTRSVCASIRSGHTPIFGNSDQIRKAACTPEYSRGSQSSGLLLPTFSGLLFLKILS